MILCDPKKPHPTVGSSSDAINSDALYGRTPSPSGPSRAALRYALDGIIQLKTNAGQHRHPVSSSVYHVFYSASNTAPDSGIYILAILCIYFLLFSLLIYANWSTFNGGRSTVSSGVYGKSRSNNNNNTHEHYHHSREEHHERRTKSNHLSTRERRQQQQQQLEQQESSSSSLELTYS